MVEVPEIEMVRTTIYMPKHVNEGLKKCVELEGKGSSVSKILSKLGARYALAHIKGNPQLPLINFIGKITTQCFFCDLHFVQLVKGKFASGLIAPVCQKCIDTVPSIKATLKKRLGVWKQGDKISGLPADFRKKTL